MKYDAAELERVFSEQLRSIAEALSALGAEYMLIGGLAVGIWAEPRATKDADLAVRVLADASRIRAALQEVGLEVMRGDLVRAVQKGEAVRLRRTSAVDTPVVIDLLFATTPFEIDALSRRVRIRVLGVELPVASPEDLFVFKIIAGRPQDIADAHVLCELHGRRFDFDRVRRWCRDFGVEQRLAAFERER